jgi:hypothetical protein
MQILKTITCFMLVSICAQYTYAQVVQPVVKPAGNLLFNTTEYIKTDSGLIINYYYKAGCKNYLVNSKFIGDSILVPLIYVANEYAAPVKPKLITIHGNISYDFFYRSKIDTPFSQQNLQQHTERVWLNILIKEKYPFKVGFTARQSNSPFYRDLYNTNLNFDRYGYTKNIKQGLLNRLNTVKWQNPELKMIDTALKLQLQKYQGLKNFINGPEALQRIIEERERAFFSKQKNKIGALKDSLTEIIPVYNKIKLPNGKTITVKADSLLNVVKKEVDLPSLKDSLASVYNTTKLPNEKKLAAQKDSLQNVYKEKMELPSDSSFAATLQNKKNQLDKLEQSITKLKYQSDSIKNSITQNVAKVKQLIYKATNPQELEKIAKQNGISEPKKEKLQSILANIKTLGIGRSMVDYTELTAQNVMLTGINVEYNPSYYTAFAAGKIDYGFRDFFGRGIKQRGQYLLLGRIGLVNKDKRSVILTVFNGRKNNYAGLLAADSGNNTAKLFGYSIETIIKKNENTFFSIEVAKSTKTKVTTTAAPVTENKPDNLFKYNDDSNMGFNIKGQTVITETDTKISGFFRKTGEQFQSFSLFTYNTNQQMWQLRADQSFLQRKVNVTAMLRQNDFTNPLTDKTFKTTTVFKSLQLNVKVPRWPVINAGYYPGTQFYIVDNNTVRENVYYILNGSALYAYKFKDIDMNSSFIYNRYFNQATDSGFVLYKGINYIFSQAVTLSKLQMEGSYSFNRQSELNYYTLDANGDYSLKKFLRIGGGIKYNHVQGGENYWGQSIRLSADFKKLGGIQLHYEKSYLPTIQQTLYPVEIGRVSWYKFF